MKIVHILFDDYPYFKTWGYQENKFAYYQSKDNDVHIITSQCIPSTLTEFSKKENLSEYEEYRINKQRKISIHRLKSLFGHGLLAKKIKFYKGLYNNLKEIDPDVIFVHDLHALGLFSVTKYIKKRKNIIYYADIHTNYINSCNGRFSIILHKYFYRFIIKRNAKYINKIFYLNNNSKEFIRDMYNITEDKYNLSLLPLGGEVAAENEILKIKKEFIKNNNLSSKSIIFLHTGKFEKKKKTLEVLKSFMTVDDSRFVLYLIGQPCSEIKEEFEKLIKKDNRIKYLGWKSNDELMDYLKISDIYLQPGSPSVTANEAMCKRNLVLLSEDGDFYTSFVDNKSAYYIKKESDLRKFFENLSNDKINIESYKSNSYKLAKQIFDYKTQSEMICK